MEKRGLTELGAWFGAVLVVLTAYIAALVTHSDAGDLRGTLIGLVTAYGIRAIKGAVDRDKRSPCDTCGSNKEHSK